MIRLFKLPQPASLVIIPVIILIFWVRAINHASPVAVEVPMPLWKLISEIFSAFPSWLNFIFLFALISCEAIYLNLILNKHEVLYKNSYLPSLFFALTISCTPELIQFHPVHFVNLLMIKVLDRALVVYKRDDSVTAIFDCGFLSGIAALLYFPAVIFLPLLLTMIVLLRPFFIKEWIILLTGFFLPYFFLSTYFFWNHRLFDFWRNYFNFFESLKPEFFITHNSALITLFVFIVLLLLLSLFRLRKNFRKNVIRTRSYQQVLFVYFLFGIAGLFLISGIHLIHFAFIVIPVSVFCAYYFLSGKKRLLLYEYALWIFIIIIVWNHMILN
jgi:hypothetical protein